MKIRPEIRCYDDWFPSGYYLCFRFNNQVICDIYLGHETWNRIALFQNWLRERVGINDQDIKDYGMTSVAKKFNEN